MRKIKTCPRHPFWWDVRVSLGGASGTLRVSAFTNAEARSQVLDMRKGMVIDAIENTRCRAKRPGIVSIASKYPETL